MPSATVLWTAGVAASPVARTLGVPTDRAGRLAVDRFLMVPGVDGVFAVGDVAASSQDGRPLPGVEVQLVDDEDEADGQHGCGDTPDPKVQFGLRWLRACCSRGRRTVNSVNAPTSLSTAIVPPCCCVTMS